MQVVDIVALLLVALILATAAAVVLRQRRMIRNPGAIQLAVRRGSVRWLYGVGQYAEGELRWYRAPGLGSRPSRVLRRGDVKVLGHRPVGPAERAALPSSAVIVDCCDSIGPLTIALSAGAFTGFTSWLEASAPSY